MSTHVTAHPAVPAASSDAAAASSLVRIDTIAPLILCALLAAGAYLAFPLYDDGWLALTLRESGPHALAQHMGDRPFFGFLLEHLAGFGAANMIVFVLSNAVIWLGFAWETAVLFRRLFPEFKNYSAVAACLTLAPIVLQTQLSTAVVSIPGNIATMLGYAALIILLRQLDVQKTSSLVLIGTTSILAACGVAVSEYGVAGNFVAATILAALAFTSLGNAARRALLISAAWLFGLTVASYLLFARVADFNTRPDVAPAHLLHRGIGKWIEVPFDVIAGAWHSLVGAYAIALGSITLAWDTKSTFVGIIVGCVIATLLYLGIRNRDAGDSREDRSQPILFRLALLIPAILVGLAPFSLMGRPTTLLEYGSRFRIPIMPIAAAMTVAFVLIVIRSSSRRFAVAMFGFLIGYSSWMFAYTFIQQSRAIASLGSALGPEVSQSADIVVAVVPFNRFESELTANIASRWPVELEKRLWVVAEEPARLQFGSRSACNGNSTLDVQMRGINRVGKLGKVLWVEAPAGQPVSIQPYCRAAD